MSTETLLSKIETRCAHPLDLLSPDEMAQAVAIVRAHEQFTATTRFVKVELREPSKQVVLNFKTGDTWEREAFALLLDNANGKTSEVVVSLTHARVNEWRHIPDVQPPLFMLEYAECGEILKADPRFQEALQKRGISDLSLVEVDAWSAGYYGDEAERTLRLSRPILYVHAEAGDNHYAHPIENLVALVDLNAKKVVRLDDYGVVPVPLNAEEYATKYIPKFRDDIKPLDIVQPHGASFTVNGYEVKWQRWSFRVGFTQREGLVLHTIGYADGGRVRPIIYRASLAEMTVPYGDPSPSQYRKNAFDVGEYGMGLLANSLQLGCDCLGEIYYFDGAMCDHQGNLIPMPNVICMHEEDYSVLWKHKEEVRRSRRLVVSFIATVGNYDYGYYWYFYQDGTIEYEVKLTGILSTGALPPDTTAKYGTLVAPQVYAPNHQHYMSVRLDMMVDGLTNSVYEVHTEAEPMGPSNPYGNAFYAKHTLLQTEQEAQQLIEPLSGRYWQIVNHASRNRMGQPVAYKLLPGDNVRMFAQPESSVAKRAGYMRHHLWVTPYHDDEKFPAGDYPNQHPGGDGLPKWTQANRSIEDTNVVVWYTLGSNHTPRLEDWPIMPVCTIGFMLKPSGFFDRNPTLDVPPSEAKPCHHP
jgi:primary-amine oxidase